MDPALIMLLLKAFSYGIVIATVFITMRFIVPSVTRNGVTFTGTAYGSVAAIVLIFFAGSILTNLLLMVLDKLLPETIIYMISYPWLLFLVSVLVDAAVVFAIGKGMPRVLFVKSYLVAIVAALIIQIATLVGSFVAIFLLSALMSIGG